MDRGLTGTSRGGTLKGSGAGSEAAATICPSQAPQLPSLILFLHSCLVKPQPWSDPSPGCSTSGLCSWAGLGKTSAPTGLTLRSNP